MSCEGSIILGAHAGHVDVGTTDAGSSHCDLGFDYSPDAFYDGLVREVKTSRSFYEPTSIEDLGTYIEQVLIYMVATETLESELWVLYLNLKDETGKTYRLHEAAGGVCLLHGARFRNQPLLEQEQRAAFLLTEFMLRLESGRTSAQLALLAASAKAGVDGMSNPDIAATLDLTVPAVKSRVHRARLLLRRRLRDYLGE